MFDSALRFPLLVQSAEVCWADGSNATPDATPGTDDPTDSPDSSFGPAAYPAADKPVTFAAPGKERPPAYVPPEKTNDWACVAGLAVSVIHVSDKIQGPFMSYCKWPVPCTLAFLATTMVVAGVGCLGAVELFGTSGSPPEPDLAPPADEPGPGTVPPFIDDDSPRLAGAHR